MISLQEPSTPYKLDLAYGIQVTVKPLTTSSMLVAQAVARQRAEKHQQNSEERKTYGLEDNQADDEEPDKNPALYQLYLLHELAITHIVDWQGVSLEGKPAPLTEKNIKAVMDLYPVGEKFLAELTLKQMLLNAAKNVPGPSPDGITPKAVGPSIAKDAQDPAGNLSDVLTSDMPLKR